MKWREREDSQTERLESLGLCGIDSFFNSGGGGTTVVNSAPDTSAMAAASKEVAEISAALGREQLAEAKRQYDQNVTFGKPILDAQLDIMNQTKQQGADYYDYLKETYRPFEKRMAAQADVAPEVMENEYANRAMADARVGQAQAQNQLIRQGLRYGWSPQRLASLGGSTASANATAQAQAAQGGRLQANNLNWARKMDVAGLGRNLPGSSIGAYSASTNAGNAAMANQMAPGNAYMAGMGQGVGTQMQGQGLRMQGLGGILNAQTSYANGINSYNAAMQGNQGGGLGALLGAGAQLGAAYIMRPSDRRLKENIEYVGQSDNGFNLYEFNYKDDPSRRYRGVMADEVEKVLPDAVAYGDDGFARVNYGALGFDMVEV